MKVLGGTGMTVQELYDYLEELIEVVKEDFTLSE